MKFSQESIILIVAAIAVGALVVWKDSQSKAAAISPASPIDASEFSPEAAPAYTSFNNANVAQGYNFGPPVVNTLPPQTMGIAGAVGSALGCSSC